MSSTFLTQCQAHPNSRKCFRLYEEWAWVCNTMTLCMTMWDNSVDGCIKVLQGSVTTLYYGGDRIFKCVNVKEARQFRLLYFKLLLMHYLVHNFFFTYYYYTWQTFIYKFCDNDAFVLYTTYWHIYASGYAVIGTQTSCVVVPYDKIKVTLPLLHHLYTEWATIVPEMMSNIFTDSSLMTRTEMVLAPLVYSPFNHLTWLLAWEYLIEFIVKALNYISLTRVMTNNTLLLWL
jgi:hypothetical protein